MLLVSHFTVKLATGKGTQEAVKKPHEAYTEEKAAELI
jgi:hypothetical protein